MTDSIHQQLLGHLLGALDDDQQEWLEAKLESDEQWRREYALWRRRLSALEALRPDFEPPVGLAERTCRLVAACAPAMAWRAASRRKMSPDGAFPSRAAHVGWFDVVAVALLMATTVALIFPAIYSSRFQARVAACQDNLRRFGGALSDYANQHGEPLSQLAQDGTLTGPGVLAAALIEERVGAGGGRAACPDAWLAAQDATHLASYAPIVRGERIGRLEAAVQSIVAPHLSGTPWRDIDDSRNGGSGTWRNGTTDGLSLQTVPAALPLLADAPSADLPGQAPPCHDGRGHNLFFADGHVGFRVSSPPTDPAETFLIGGDSFATPAISTPVTFVNGH